MKSLWIGALCVALATTLTPDFAEAKRLGSGKNSGMQRDMPARTSPDAPPAQPAAPMQAANPATAGAATAATGAAAAAGKKSWLGPIAGLAAGIGLVALMSHLGLGEAFANFLMIALLVMAAVALFFFIRRRMGGAQRTAQPALAGAGAGGSSPTQVAWPAPQQPAAPMERTAAAPLAAGSATPAAPAVTRAFVPATFDSEGFERVAKMIFIRLQAANDSANLDDLRQFTTPEMFASLKLDLLDRGSSVQTTEVKRVEAKVEDVAEEADRLVVSVRYRGEIVEAAGEAPQAFDEVWHLVQPRGGEAWLIAGIEQMA